MTSGTHRARTLLVADRDRAAGQALTVVLAVGRTLAREYPFHAALLSQWSVVTNRVLDTAGVTARGDGVYLIVNPEFALAIREDELLGVLHHELNHVLFGHILADPDDFPDRRARIIAEEVTVNEWVPEPLPGQPIVLSDFPDLPPNEDTGTRYRRLERLLPPTMSAMPGTTDDHSVWSGDGGAGDELGGGGEAGKLSVLQAIRAAAEASGERGWRALPSELQAAVENTAGVAPGGGLEELVGTGTSHVDWRGALRHIIAAEVGTQSRFGRPPRRYPHLVGIVPARVHVAVRPRVLAVIDTSGSITTSILEDISAELDAMSPWADITIVECDAEIHDVYPYSERLQNVRGRGGTDLRPPFEPEFMAAHHPDVVVYFTDGFGPAPERAPRVRTFWCLTPGGEPPATWGRVLRMR